MVALVVKGTKAMVHEVFGQHNFKIYMAKKFIAVLMAAVVGASVGAMLGYGPLLRYKAEGVLSMDMGTTEYKRFTELANDVETFGKFAALQPPSGIDAKRLSALSKSVEDGKWHKPVPRVSKADAKDLPDILVQMEQDRVKALDKSFDEKRKVTVPAYLGLKLTGTGADPVEAAVFATWLGAYAMDVATHEAVRDQVSQWKAENWKFSDRAREQRLKYEFTIEQAATRAAALKTVVASYPESARREGSQVVDVRKDNEKFISPQAQLVGAESEIIEIRQKIKRLDRELEQQAFTETLIGDVQTALKQARSGSESVIGLSGVLTQYDKKVKSDAEREKLLSLAADLSQISGRFLTQAQFISQPSAPLHPERPGPLLVIVFGALLSALLAGVFIWRNSIAKLLAQDSAT